MLMNAADRYGNVAKFFHWLIFFLLLGMLVFGYFMDDLPKAYKAQAYNWHKLTGLTVLSLMLLRLFWKLVNPKPELPFKVGFLEKLAEHSVHGLLYVVVIAMPLAGWIGSSAAGKFPHVGAMELALPIEQSKAVVELAFELHELIAIVIMVLVGLHVLAALYHHYILKDNVLKRML